MSSPLPSLPSSSPFYMRKYLCVTFFVESTWFVSISNETAHLHFGSHSSFQCFSQCVEYSRHVNYFVVLNFCCCCCCLNCATLWLHLRRMHIITQPIPMPLYDTSQTTDVVCMWIKTKTNHKLWEIQCLWLCFFSHNMNPCHSAFALDMETIVINKNDRNAMERFASVAFSFRQIWTIVSDLTCYFWSNLSPLFFWF